MPALSFQLPCWVHKLSSEVLTLSAPFQVSDCRPGLGEAGVVGARVSVPEAQPPAQVGQTDLSALRLF